MDPRVGPGCRRGALWKRVCGQRFWRPKRLRLRSLPAVTIPRAASKQSRDPKGLAPLLQNGCPSWLACSSPSQLHDRSSSTAVHQLPPPPHHHQPCSGHWDLGSANDSGVQHISDASIASPVRFSPALGPPGRCRGVSVSSIHPPQHSSWWGTARAFPTRGLFIFGGASRSFSLRRRSSTDVLIS
jgi:hypothetical protein